MGALFGLSCKQHDTGPLSLVWETVGCVYFDIYCVCTCLSPQAGDGHYALSGTTIMKNIHVEAQHVLLMAGLIPGCQWKRSRATVNLTSR